MREKYKKSEYPSKNIKTETYKDGDTSVTKHYYDAKNAYVRELIYLTNGVREVKHFTVKGVLSKVEHFEEDKRHGVETKYFIPKANKSVKSTKTYYEGKLHGECITYNDNDEIIKQEVYATGKLIFKYLRNDSNNNDITNVQIIDNDNIENLPKIEYDKLQDNKNKNPDWFIDT